MLRGEPAMSYINICEAGRYLNVFIYSLFNEIAYSFAANEIPREIPWVVASQFAVARESLIQLSSHAASLVKQIVV